MVILLDLYLVDTNIPVGISYWLSFMENYNWHSFLKFRNWQLQLDFSASTQVSRNFIQKCKYCSWKFQQLHFFSNYTINNSIDKWISFNSLKIQNYQLELKTFSWNFQIPTGSIWRRTKIPTDRVLEARNSNWYVHFRILGGCDTPPHPPGSYTPAYIIYTLYILYILHTYIHTYIHIYIHTYIHIYIHT